MSNPPVSRAQTPETYLGYDRAELFANVEQFIPDQTVEYSFAETLSSSFWSLDGDWVIGNESSTSKSDNSKLRLNFTAKNVYLVMGSETEQQVEVKISNQAGLEIMTSTINVGEPTLYELVDLTDLVSEYEIELTVPSGVELNAFTFGS